MPTPRYYHENGKIYDAGVELTDGEVQRMLDDYPAKIQRNADTAKNFPPAQSASDLANSILSNDLRQLQEAKQSQYAQKLNPRDRR